MDKLLLGMSVTCRLYSADDVIIIIIKLYFDTIKSGATAPFTGVYRHQFTRYKLVCRYALYKILKTMQNVRMCKIILRKCILITWHLYIKDKSQIGNKMLMSSIVQNINRTDNM